MLKHRLVALGSMVEGRAAATFATMRISTNQSLWPKNPWECWQVWHKEQVITREKKGNISSNTSFSLAMLVYLGLNQKDMSDMSLEIHPSLLRSFQQEPHPALCEDFLHRDAPGCRYCMPLHLGQLHVFTPCVRALGGLQTALFHDESKSRQIWRWSWKPRKSIPFSLTRRKTRGILSISSTLSSNSSHHWKYSLLQWPQDRWAEQNPLKTELSIMSFHHVINCIKQATAFFESWGQLGIVWPHWNHLKSRWDLKNLISMPQGFGDLHHGFHPDHWMVDTCLRHPRHQWPS